ncbi:fibrinogen-related protein 3-2 [Plakobranchus ocellatus]|uniref:Fibrinogen-related protein 3-2 n=1 Tax=Plakobranchus ocellatus TaxID=259542 RepID=A0AAV3Z946_9GAST|nr:fibrinogen-related protein 3-2 [Plakobranchus ocellatus]
MKNELFSTAALILLCLNACCEGIKLVLNRDFQVVVGSRITCGILLCEEKFPPTNASISSIFNMTVFKNQPSCSGTSEDESETQVVVASINAKQRNISRITDATRASGVLRRRNASLRIHMFKHEDCSSDFICEVYGLDSQRKSFLSTTTLLQQQGDNYMSYEILASSLRKVKEKLVRLAVKFKSAFTGVSSQISSLENKMSSLENTMDDNIDSKLSALNKEYNLDGNKYVLTKKLSTLRRELSDAQQNFETNILDYIDARFFSNQIELIHKLRGSISRVISSGDNALKAAFDNIVSSQQTYQESIKKFQSHLYSNTRKVQSTLGVVNGQISQLRRSIRNLKSSITDIMQPSTCKRGMIRPSSSYPYPHPVIYPPGKSGQGPPYLCDMFTDGGGWIVIQRRSTGKVDFYRDWETYKKGFGTFDDEFWLGNERIHAFTSSGTWELRVDLKYKKKDAYALYSSFKVESEWKQYTLRLGSYSGTAGNSFIHHNGQKFSTYDRDNDSHNSYSCAKSQQGGWWYNACDYVDLNSRMNGKPDKGLEWHRLAHSDSCSFSEMKIRRVA